MIERSFNAGFINSVINHPTVREGSEVNGSADVSKIVEDERNYLLANEHGGFIAINTEPRVYEYHTQFLPEGRGLSAIEAGWESLAYMFNETDCEKIITQVNTNNKTAQRYTALFPFRKVGADDYIHYEMSAEDWSKHEQH